MLLTRFQGEITLMTKLRHPNIIQTYGACWPKHDPTSQTVDDFGRCVIMEYAQLGSLNNLLGKQGEQVGWFPRGGGVFESEIMRCNKLAWAIQIARGMVRTSETSERD